MKAQARKQGVGNTARRWPLHPWLGAGVLVLLLLVASVAGMRAVLAQTGLAHVQVRGPFERVSEGAVAEVLRSRRGQRVMALDLTRIERELSLLPWVDEIRLRRLWPDGVRVEVEEHRAVARWGETALVNERGELFVVQEPSSLSALPVFNGPHNRAAEMLATWRDLRVRLAEHELEAAQLLLDRRGSWRLVLARGVEVRLGTADPLAQTERFLRHGWPEIADRVERVRYVDLRYTNGFAVAEHRRDTEGG